MRVQRMTSPRSISTAALLAAFCVGPLTGEAAGQIDFRTARTERRLPAVRATDAIRIDGALDEPDWSRAPLALVPGLTLTDADARPSAATEAILRGGADLRWPGG